MLYREDSIDQIIKYTKTGIKYTTYIFKCSNMDCDNTFKAQRSGLRTHSKFCASCSAINTRKWVVPKTQLRQFEALYNRFLKKAKASNRKVFITYQQFLLYTKITKCEYCETYIDWSIKHKYNLDRKNSELDYTEDNIAICCPLCNMTKRDEFTYDEFKIIGKSIREIRKTRESI